MVLLLWGGSAISILKKLPKGVYERSVCTSHPSPLGWKKTVGVHPSFFGSDCFEEVNAKLRSGGYNEINWKRVL